MTIKLQIWANGLTMFADSIGISNDSMTFYTEAECIGWVKLNLIKFIRHYDNEDGNKFVVINLK